MILARVVIATVLCLTVIVAQRSSADEAKVLASIGDYLAFEVPASLNVTVTGQSSGSLSEQIRVHLTKGGQLPDGAVYVQINALSLGGRFLMRDGGFTIRGMNSESPAITDEMRATGNSVPLVDLDGDGRREGFHIEPGGAGVINRWAPHRLEMSLTFPAVVQLRSTTTDGSGRQIDGTRKISVNVHADVQAAWNGPSIGSADGTQTTSELDAIDTTEPPGHGNLYTTADGEQKNTGVRVVILDRNPLRLDLELIDANGPQNAGLVLVFPGDGRPQAGTYVVSGQEPATGRLQLTLSGPSKTPTDGRGTVTILNSGLTTVGEISLPVLQASGRFAIDL
jgi:hypothetical protein